MGPLVPELIGEELNLVIAFFIGIGFGFILEQAGFSTSKKLVGLFYGYDFTVLRVFFTAGITAMLGLVIMAHFSLIDLSMVYVNPTFLWSAVIGGLIMGLGFVVGGFCPGTSFCAAAIGKIDALIFIAGGALGVLVFAEAYPALEPLYKAEFWGNVRIFETLGMSQGLFAFLLTVMALGAFYATGIIEKKVNKGETNEATTRRVFTSFAVVFLILGIAAIFLPDKRESVLSDMNNKEALDGIEFSRISIDELALRLMNNDKKYQIIDTRSEKEYALFHLPGAINVPLEKFYGKENAKAFRDKSVKRIFIGANKEDEIKAAYVATQIGIKDPLVLEGGLQKFREEIIGFDKAEAVNKGLNADTERFRLKAASLIPILIEKDKQTGAPKKVIKKVMGGC